MTKDRILGLIKGPRRMKRGAGTLVCVLLLLSTAGCGGNSDANKTPLQPSPQMYFAPFVNGTNVGVPQLYAIDDHANKFSQTTNLIQLPEQQGPQTINAGTFTTTSRALRSLDITVNYIYDQTDRAYIPNPNPPKGNSFALELSGQAGGLVQLAAQPVAPLVPTTACPASSTAQTYLYVTIPGPQASSNAGLHSTWDPTTDTAYGTVDVSSSGSTVNFKNIHQFKLPPSAGVFEPPAQPSASSQTGICASTFFGDITNVPGQLVIGMPGNGQQVTPQASIGIAANGGLLVEDNGSSASAPLPDTSPNLYYNNVLGAGTGAIGLPKPSSAIDTGALIKAQYLGFIYNAGINTNASNPPAWASHLASFGLVSEPSTCASVTAPTPTLIYGGDFANDDPSGFGNCDFALDLGAEDTSNNGLYPQATVWVGGKYANGAGTTSSKFPAVAIAGQINGKYALFLIGADPTEQPWSVYLLQSN